MDEFDVKPRLDPDGTINKEYIEEKIKRMQERQARREQDRKHAQADPKYPDGYIWEINVLHGRDEDEDTSRQGLWDALVKAVEDNDDVNLLYSPFPLKLSLIVETPAGSEGPIDLTLPEFSGKVEVLHLNPAGKKQKKKSKAGTKRDFASATEGEVQGGDAQPRVQAGGPENAG